MQCDAIKGWLWERGITQVQVAKKAGVNHTYVAALINGLEPLR